MIPSNDQVPIHDLLDELAKLKISSVLVEAGATLTGSFVAGSLIDELVAILRQRFSGIVLYQCLSCQLKILILICAIFERTSSHWI
ncbi:MAG: hypothetical protein CM15mP51_10170 [Porticoccaceae bacterium]|nr:MAG: hypothetical protein CM15mP51_10170 [Porticoccaceae bacterium]